MDWSNLVLLTYWKKTRKLLKLVICNVYVDLPDEYRALLLFYVALKAAGANIKMKFSQAMLRDYAHIGDGEVASASVP